MQPSYGQPGPAGNIVGQLSDAIMVIGAAFAIAIGILLLIAIVRRLLYIARPNEALIFSGKAHTTEDGQKLGFRVVTSGRRAFRIPVLERVDRMDMTLIPIDVVVQNAYSSGNIPLKIHAIANVKIHSDTRYIHNAVERFLGRQRNEIQLVAQQTLEGALREVLAQLTPEQVNEDRLTFAAQLSAAAEDDLNKLGLGLDTLKIQNVADDTGYLDSLGRPRIAGALRDAENAESKALQEITQAQAGLSQRAEVAKANAETQILQKRNELRRVKAELEGNAQAVEREAEAAAKTARAEAERDLQAMRSDLEQRRLQAEVVIPAEVRRAAKQILAKGDAAPVIENGAAQIEVLRLLSEAWVTMGAEAKELYVIQHLDEIVGTGVQNMAGLQVDEVNVLDQGDGSGLATYAAAYPQMVAEVLRALKATTGVDVPAILMSASGTGNGGRAS